MGDNKELVLVYDGMVPISRDDRFSIVLTPQNYIIKKENLPIKQEYQSKKIASSLFDEWVEDKDKYSYFVYKDDDESWIFIAYKQEEVMEMLERVGVSSNNVDEIFFVQQMVSSIAKPISLGDDKALVSIDGIATVVQKSMLPKDTEYEHISHDIQPKKAVVLSKESIFDTRTTMLFGLVFVIFGLLFLIEGRNMSKNKPENQQQIETILQNNPSLSSSYTRSSILTKYTKIDKQERTKRDIVAKLSKLITSKVKVDKFIMAKNQFSVLLYIDDASVMSSALKRAKQNGFVAKKISSNQLSIEGKL